MNSTSLWNDSRPPVAACMVGVAATGILLLMVNSGFTILKEDPLFWYNAGGFSVTLRALVLFFYYPLLVTNFVLCAVFSYLVAYEYRLRARFPWWAMVMGVALWSLLLLNVGLLTANNVENFLLGRSFHYHQPIIDQL